MNELLEFLARNAYAALFLAVFTEQIGIPLPSAPWIVAAGALAAAGQIHLLGALAACLVASVLADSIWFALGHRSGGRVLRFLCRISLEPDSCVRSTEDGFTRHGPWLLILAKFVPGLGTVAPPLAGVVGIGVTRFLVFDSLGILAVSSILLAAGYSLGGPIGRLARWLATEGSWTLLLILAAVAAWVAWKFWRRRSVIRELHMARVTPADLKDSLDAGEPVVIIDLRHDLTRENGDGTLPGAIRMQPQELESRHREIPRDRDVVLFCT
jgi:membrane protein DedA with SNARE-associated domain